MEPLPLQQEDLPALDTPPAARGARPWLVGLVVLIVIACFARVVFNGMSPIDDSGTITFQKRMNPPQFTADGVGYFWTHADFAIYMPLTQTFWALLAKATYVPTADANGFHVDVRVFHAANVLWHAINVALVYGLIRFLLGVTGVAGRQRSQWCAAAGALLYGLHPLQVEAVAWLSGTKDAMYTTASLASIWLYLRAVAPEEMLPPDEPPPTDSARGVMYAIGLLLVPIGMLCKPTAMVAPLVAAAIDWCVLRRPLRRVIVATIPYLLVAIPLAIVAKKAQPATAVPLPAVWERPAISGSSIAFYLYKFALPTRLAFDYDWRPMKMWAEPWFIPTGVATVVVLLILFGVGRRRWPWVAAAVAVFVAALLPVLGLSRFTMQFFSTVGDHYLTLALLAPAMVLARLLVAASRRTAPMAILSLACVAWFIWLGMLTFRQIGTWRTPEEFSRHTIAVTPSSSLAHNSLGEWLQHKGRWGDAEQEFLQAARSNDRFFSPLIALARLYAREGRVDDAIEATEWLMEVHARYPANARPDYSRFILEAVIPEAVQAGHIADVPRYKEEQAKLFPPQASSTAPATSPPRT